MKPNDLTGHRYGRLVVLARVENDRRGRARWRCRCDCGRDTVVGAGWLRNGDTTSCGCYRRSKNYRTDSGLNRVYANYSRGAVVRGLDFLITKDQFRETASRSCAYCGAPPSMVLCAGTPGEFTYNGIDRIDSNVGYIPGNVVPACTACNYAKRNMSLDSFKDWISRVYAHLNGNRAP